MARRTVRSSHHCGARALDRPLSASDVAALETLVPKDAIGGTRYAAEQMKHLDGER